jgi:hypothetical protein
MDPNPFTNLDPVTNPDPYKNLNLVTNPNPITNLDLRRYHSTTSPLLAPVRSTIFHPRRPIGSRTLANPPDLENQFYIDDCSNLSTVALRRAIFKQKKGFANLSLDLF